VIDMARESRNDVAMKVDSLGQSSVLRPRKMSVTAPMVVTKMQP